MKQQTIFPRNSPRWKGNENDNDDEHDDDDENDDDDVDVDRLCHVVESI